VVVNTNISNISITASTMSLGTQDVRFSGGNSSSTLTNNRLGTVLCSNSDSGVTGSGNTVAVCSGCANCNFQ
jgi:hypothetical protein